MMEIPARLRHKSERSGSGNWWGSLLLGEHGAMWCGRSTAGRG